MQKEQRSSSNDTNSLVSSIIPALSAEGRNFLQPSFRRSQSVTALATLQREVDNLEDSKLPAEHDEERKGPERCASLPHLRWRGMDMSRPSNGDGDNMDNISITSAAKSEDRVKELETDLTDARDTIQSLRDTVLDQKENLTKLMCQLNVEREQSKTLQEELQISRQLCIELNAASRPSSSESEKYYYAYAKTPRHVSVREVAVQVALGDHDYAIKGNGAKNRSSLNSMRSRAINQKDDLESPSLSPRLKRQLGLSNHYDSRGRSCDNGIRDPMHEEVYSSVHQQLREKEFQIHKLTEKLSKYLQRNAELEAEQISRQENLEAAESKLEYRDQEVAHLKEVVLHQQEDITLLEQIKENLHSRCTDLEKREQELEELVDTLNEDMHGISKEKKKLSRHIKDLNSSLETKQIEITEKIEELEAQSNLLEVIKQVAFGSPSRKKLHTPRSVTTTPRNSPAGPTPRQSTNQKDDVIKDYQQFDAAVVDHRQTSARSQRETRSKGKSSEKMPSKQERRHASRSLNYNECAHPGETDSNSDLDADGGYHGDHDDDDDGVQPINGFYNNSYVSSSEDVRELSSPSPSNRAQLAESPEKALPREGLDVPNDFRGEDVILVEGQKFLQDIPVSHSSPKTKDEHSVDDLIAEVLAELAEEEKCEADKRPVPASDRKELAAPTKMESEGLLLRKHELENYAMRARDRSWQYVYVVQHGPQLWFYESKEHQQQGRTYDGEGPLDLTAALVSVAPDYTKRKHVFRVQLPNGQRFLFQARDDREMLYWVCSMDSGTRQSQSTDDGDTFNGVTPGIGVVPPPVTASPSKTDRLRNMIKGSISALTK